MGTGGTWFGFTGRQPSDIAGFGAVCGNRGRLSLARHGENPRVTLLVCALQCHQEHCKTATKAQQLLLNQA